ncbi:hypothetical protein CPIN18020_0348 [Campylobacter pinnipediorum subsp. caledonicus]|uniref:hypothetical protein n=1 Tax=Campylobacter pinnipediorum TaxID=1965231 RepID=UPI0009954818|nr:hypothetical protein [Campylobacter pinnipediorum]AQW85589.1 hypothetical protein CPIN18020_0348 [Campylobacter pinnipediorum subsp. caledonicus]
MGNLFTTSSEVTKLQTFTTEQVAKGYGVVTTTIKNHKADHSDEIVENIHYIYEQALTKGGKQEVLKWTLRGIIKLGMFIRSKEAKHFRLWAEQELEKSMLKELEKANELREKNKSYINEISSLNAVLIDKAKRHQRVVNAYKSNLSQRKNEITILKNEIAKAKAVNDNSYKALYHNARLERDCYINANERLKAMFADKEKRVFEILQNILKQVDKTYGDIGALVSYVWEDNDYFINQRRLNGAKSNRV